MRRIDFIVMGAALCLLLTAPVMAKDAPEGSRPTYVSAEEVKGWLDEGEAVTFLDVRDEDEFAAGHIEGAIHVPYEQVASSAEKLPKNHSIVLYCIHSAHRAPAATKTLKALGFSSVFVLEGGLVAWREAGFPIRAQDLAKAPTILPKTERCANAASPSPSSLP